MTVNTWLIANVGLDFIQFGTVIGLLGSLAFNFYQHRERSAAHTIQLNNATIKNIETMLVAERHALAKSKSEAEKCQSDNEKQRVEIESQSKAIDALHTKISELENKLSERESALMLVPHDDWQ